MPLDLKAYRCLMQPGVDLPSFVEVIGRPSWMNQGACRDEPTTTFFPAVGDSQKVMAKACAG